MLDFRTGKLAGWPQKSISSGNYGTVNEGIILNKEVIWDDYLKHITKDILREKFWEKCQLLLKFMLATLDLYLGHRERKWKWKSLMEKNSGVGSLSLLHRIFPTQGSNPSLPHCRRVLYHLSHKGSPSILEWVAYPFSSISSWPRNRTSVTCIAGFFTNWAIREAPERERSIIKTEREVLPSSEMDWRVL